MAVMVLVTAVGFAQSNGSFHGHYDYDRLDGKGHLLGEEIKRTIEKQVESQPLFEVNALGTIEKVFYTRSGMVLNKTVDTGNAVFMFEVDRTDTPRLIVHVIGKGKEAASSLKSNPVKFTISSRGKLYHVSAVAYEDTRESTITMHWTDKEGQPRKVNVALFAM